MNCSGVALDQPGQSVVLTGNEAVARGAIVGSIKFYGKNSGDVAGPRGPFVGELDPDIMAGCLSRIFGVPYSPPTIPNVGEARQLLDNNIPSRELALCAGCPRRGM